MERKKQISDMITVSRAIALISIVSAHIFFTAGTPELITEFYKKIASIGVVTYMVISGYLYSPEHYGGFGKMIVRKLSSIGVPWLFLGTVSYLYNAVLSRNLSVYSYLKFIIGNGSYLYFMTMLFLCFVIGYFIKSRAIKIIFICVNVLSIELTAAGILDPVIKSLHITNYLNIFNWLGFFMFGNLISSIDPGILFDFIKKTRLVFVAAFVLLTGAFIIFDVKTGYFSFVGWAYELVGAMAIFGISSISKLNMPLLRTVSNYSFSVYLIHFMVIGVMDRIYNLFVPLQVVANILVVAVSVLAVYLCLLIAKIIKLDKIASMLFGVRKR